MTSCRTDGLRRLRFAAAVCALVGALPASALAQATGRPLALINPAGTPAGTPAPAAAVPGAPSAAVPVGQALPVAGPAAPGVPPQPVPAPPPLPTVDPREVTVDRQTLAAPPLGALTPAEAALPATLWAGTPAPVLRGLLPVLPDSLPSPALHDLARRLLLVAAPVDAGQADLAPLAELRISRLLALGELDAAGKLAAALPMGGGSPAIDRLRWQILLLAGRTAEACAILGGADGEVEAAEARALCQFATGDAAGGNFALEILRDRKPADPLFLQAAETLAGQPPDKPATALKDLTPLQFAAWRAAKLPFTPEAVDTARPLVLAAMASATDLDPELRLAAAERAEALGLVDAAAFRRQVTALEFSQADLAQPLAHLDGKTPAHGLALLSRAAEVAVDPAVRQPLLAKGLELAAARGRYATAARLLAPQIAALPSQPDFAAFASQAARALLVAGLNDDASRWLSLAALDPALGPDGAKAATRLWPLARARGLGDPSPAALSAWLAAVDPKQAVAVLGLLSGLGQHVPEATWITLLSVPRAAAGPGPAVSELLAAMARDGRVGGTALAALAHVGATGVEHADPAVIAGLHAVGLDVEARRLAVEAILAAGL